MKNIIFLLLCLNIFSSNGQVIADPAVSDMKIVSTILTPVDPALLVKDSVVMIKIPIFNRNLVNNLPSGTCKIKIGLGSKLEIDPAFNLGTANTSNYFQWTAENSGGQSLITGDLVAVLPANFNDTLVVNIRGKIVGNSTITTNFLITNHNTTVNLSDENGANNNTFLPYTVVAAGGPLPVTFTGLQVAKENCVVNATVYTQNELNVRRYELEVSTDGIHYESRVTLPAAHLSAYHFSFVLDEPINQSAYLFFRVKSTDIDGHYQYSMTRKVNGGCENAKEQNGASLFPNPLPGLQKELYIRNEEAVFNGKYLVSLYNMKGKLLAQQTVAVNNSKQFVYKTNHLPAGQYVIRLSGNDGIHYQAMKFQKL